METPLLSSAIPDKLLLLRSHPPFLGTLVPISGFEITDAVTEMDSQWGQTHSSKAQNPKGIISMWTARFLPLSAPASSNLKHEEHCKTLKFSLTLLITTEGSKYTDWEGNIKGRGWQFSRTPSSSVFLSSTLCYSCAKQKNKAHVKGFHEYHRRREMRCI